MIKGNTIEFGYGDVVVGVDQFKRCLIITNIKPPVACGTKFRKVEDTNDVEFGESIEIYEDNLHDIYNLVCTVNEKNKIVKYKQWIFDFSNYNKESVRVMKDFAFNIIDVRCLAC